MPEPVAFAGEGGRYRIGVFEFDARILELRKNGRVVKVRPQSLKLLNLLLDRPGELVPRGDIEQALWGRETFVDFEQGVNHCIKELRAAFGDSSDSPRYIQTLPRRGYVFIAPIQAERTLAPPPPAPADASAPPRRRFGPVWLQAIALAAVIAGIALLLYAARSGGTESSPAPALTVLPFSTSQPDAALGAGLANAIAARLGGQQLLSIRPTGAETSSADDETMSLEGEIDANGVDLAVVARLKDATGAVLWSDRFRARADEFFSVENVIAERVVAALNLQLAAAEQDRLRRRYTSNTAAYEEYLRGRAVLMTYTLEGTRSAVEAFERALQRDSNYALARADTGFPCLTWFERDPLLAPMRRLPEFSELLAYVRTRRDSTLTRVD